jgi:prephenate dehydrogenase
LEYRIDGRQSDKVKRDMQSDIETIEQYLEGVRKDVTKYNSGIRDIARQNIEKRIEQLKENREVIEDLGISKEQMR